MKERVMEIINSDNTVTDYEGFSMQLLEAGMTPYFILQRAITISLLDQDMTKGCELVDLAENTARYFFEDDRMESDNFVIISELAKSIFRKVDNGNIQ